jgi:hypothetical protein
MTTKNYLSLIVEVLTYSTRYIFQVWGGDDDCVSKIGTFFVHAQWSKREEGGGWKKGGEGEGGEGRGGRERSSSGKE